LRTSQLCDLPRLAKKKFFFVTIFGLKVIRNHRCIMLSALLLFLNHDYCIEYL